MEKIIPYIRQYRLSDVKQIIALSDKEFGKGYLTLEHLNGFLNDSNRFCFVIDLDAEIIGFSLLELWSNDELKQNKINLSQSFTNKDGVYGVLKTVAVSTNHRLQGLGTALARVGLSYLKQVSSSFLSIVWEKANDQNFTRILEKIDMVYYKTVEKYWYNDSRLKEYKCVYCGLPPCKCNARIYFLNLI